MDLIQTIRTEYDRLDRITGVDTKPVQIKISGRMTRTLGLFKQGSKLRGTPMEIVISKRICDDEDLFLDVIRHEYAHMIVYLRAPREKHVHDSVWKAACMEVGCEPKATRKTTDPYIPSKSLPDKYIVRCKSCGAESRYRAAGNVVKILLHKKRGKVVCKKCKGTNFEIITLK